MKLKIFVSAIFLVSTFQITAQAGGGNQVPECQAPVAACKAAGFKSGAHKKGDSEGADNGLWVDCIGAVADGKKQVAGVDPSAAQACKAAIKAHKHSK